MQYTENNVIHETQLPYNGLSIDLDPTEFEKLGSFNPSLRIYEFLYGFSVQKLFVLTYYFNLKHVF